MFFFISNYIINATLNIVIIILRLHLSLSVCDVKANYDNCFFFHLHINLF